MCPTQAAPPRTPVPAPGELMLLAVGVLGVSMSGPLMAAIAAPALAIAFWRNALGSLAVAPVALLRHREELRGLSTRGMALTLLAGLLLAGHFALWVTALKLTSVASATALVSLQAGFVVAFSRLTGGRVGRRVVTGLLLAILGVLVVSGVDLSVSARALGGDGLALAGGALAAVYVMLGGEVRRTVSTTAYTQLCYATCAAALLLACLLGHQQLWGYDARDWWRLAALHGGGPAARTLGVQPSAGHDLTDRGLALAVAGGARRSAAGGPVPAAVASGRRLPGSCAHPGRAGHRGHAGLGPAGRAGPGVIVGADQVCGS